MIWKTALKYPVLVIGIIFFGLFITDPKTKSYWTKQKRRFIPSTCDAVLDRIYPKVPDYWELKCPGTELLIVDIEYKKEASKLLKANMYKYLANSLMKIGSYSHLETLEYLKHVQVNVNHELLSINSITDGEAISELSKMKDKKQIAGHLRLTVKIKEIRQ